MTVYVYYEMNYHELACETAPVVGIKVFATHGDAVSYLKSRAEAYVKDGFKIDTECDYENELKDTEEISVTMFLSYQENWDEAFSICISRKEVQQ